MGSSKRLHALSQADAVWGGHAIGSDRVVLLTSALKDSPLMLTEVSEGGARSVEVQLPGIARFGAPAALMRLGDRVAVATRTHVGVWTRLEDAPTLYALDAPITDWGPSIGGTSDDPLTGVWLLHEPRNVPQVTGIVTMRLAKGVATFRGDETGAPLRLRASDLPVPPMIVSSGLFRHPVLTSVAWRRGHLYVFSPGMSPGFAKHGNHFSVIARVDPATGTSSIIAAFDEPCLGELRHDGAAVLVTPTRATGPWKGKPRQAPLGSAETLPLAPLPKHARVIDHVDDRVWFHTREGVFVTC